MFQEVGNERFWCGQEERIPPSVTDWRRDTAAVSAVDHDDVATLDLGLSRTTSRAARVDLSRGGIFTPRCKYVTGVYAPVTYPDCYEVGTRSFASS